MYVSMEKKAVFNFEIEKKVNNYPLTKYKTIYHARISKQMKWQGFPEPFHFNVPSVINLFIFGQAVVIYFIMQLLVKKTSKQPNSFTPK